MSAVKRREEDATAMDQGAEAAT
jgi:hypothetical protein